MSDREKERAAFLCPPGSAYDAAAALAGSVSDCGVLNTHAPLIDPDKAEDSLTIPSLVASERKRYSVGSVFYSGLHVYIRVLEL